MTEPRRLDHLPLGGEGGLPYSKGLLARALMATGLRRYMRGSSLSASRPTSSCVMRRRRPRAPRRAGAGRSGRERRCRCRAPAAPLPRAAGLDLPIVVLVGGGTGTGKSRVATEIAYRLGITRVTSTDFIRQTMRAFFSEEFMPSIHYSSFEAGPAAPEADDPTLAGFLDQTRNVLVGVRAVIERALHEGWSMVLEGVHLVPGLVPPVEGALAVQFVLEIESEDVHAGHFWVRDAQHRGPAAGRALHRAAGRDPAGAGLHRRSGESLRRAGDRELEHRRDDRRCHGSRARERGEARRGRQWPRALTGRAV